jgi:hypothetical protein
VLLDGHPLYSDSHHLSTHGADFVIEALQPIFAR